MALRDQETSCLLDALVKNRDLAFNIVGGAFVDKAALLKGWEKVTLQMNSLGFGKYKRSVREVKKKWLDLRLRVKKKAAQINEDRIKTGGGEGTRDKLTPLEERVIFLIGKTSSEGITDCTYDTDRPKSAGIKLSYPRLSQKPFLLQDVEIIPSTTQTSTILLQGAEVIPPVSRTSTVIHQDAEIPSTSHAFTVLQDFESCPSPAGSTQASLSPMQAQASEPEMETEENISVPVRGLKNLNAAILKTPRVVGFKRRKRLTPKTKLDVLADIEKRKLEMEEEKLQIKRSRLENELSQTELLREQLIVSKEQVNLLKQLLKGN